MGQRFIVFAEPSVGWVPSLLDSFLSELKRREDIEWVKVCATCSDSPRLRLAVATLLRFAGKALFNPRMAQSFETPRLATVSSVAKKHGVEVIAGPGYKINDPDFIRELETKHQPTMALSLACLQIWKAKLIGTFRLAVNFHNGYLPDYKGLWATHWSVYNGENYSGYAYHVMDEDIDTGPIIIRGRVPIRPDDGPLTVERRKIRAAQKDVSKLLDAMITGQFEPIAQSQGGSYHSGKASQNIWTIDDPSALSADELFRRLRSFAPLSILISGTRYPITSLRLARSPRRTLAFVTADGKELYPDRLQYIPTALYLALKTTANPGNLLKPWRRSSDPRA